MTFAPCGRSAFPTRTAHRQRFPKSFPSAKSAWSRARCFCSNVTAHTLSIDARAKALLAGLWQFPNTEGQLSPSDALQAAENFGVNPIELLRETHKTHIFTHIRWEMVGYHIRCREKNGIFLWVTPRRIAKHLCPADGVSDFFWRTIYKQGKSTRASEMLARVLIFVSVPP